MMSSNASRRGSMITALVVGVLVVLAALLPFVHRSVGALLPGPLDSPGTLQMLSMMLVVGALAVSMYLLLGVTGLLSMGHGMYFALGAYGVVMLTNYTGLPFWVAAFLSVLMSTVVAFVVNGIALRSTGIAFSMITLAFVELLSIGVARGFLGSGSDQGLTLSFEKTPEIFRGLANMPNIYWLALGLAVVISLVVWFFEKRTGFGRVWIGIRQNELRTETIGFDVYGYKIAVTVLGSMLASVCGVAYAIVTSGVNPEIASVMYSIGLILMVILGGRKVVWGAFLGGALYMYLTLRLPAFTSADAVKDLGPWARIPLSQPEFLLGILFVLVILLLPNGLADGLQRLFRSIARFVPRRRTPREHGQAI